MYKIGVEYLDVFSAPQSASSSAFTQSPGFIMSIADFNAATAVKVRSAVTGALLAQYSGFPASCGECWPTAQMVDEGNDPVPFWVAWDPTAKVIIIADDESVIGPTPRV